MAVAPGVFWAIGLGFGIFVFFYPLSLLFLVLFFTYLLWLKGPWKSFCICAFFGLSIVNLTLKLPEKTSTTGKASFTPSRIEKRVFFGKPNYVYNGTLNSLGKAYNLPCSLRLNKRLLCLGTWELEATLKQTDYRFFLSPTKPEVIGDKKNKPALRKLTCVSDIKTPPLKSFLNQSMDMLALGRLGEIRYQFQKKACFFLERHIYPKSSAKFLSALFLGIKPSDSMRFEFSRAGLSHLLVVSGFHFALIAGLFGYVLNSFFSPRLASAIQIAVLCSYFLTLGSSPSVQRAFLVCFFYYFGILINRPSRPEHALGLAALFELIFSPLSVLNIGFQLSYLITLAILLFFEPVSIFIKKIWHVSSEKLFAPERVLREAVTLNIAVTFASLPLSLFHFYTFPIASLIYNLFIPPLTALAMTLALPCILLLAPFPNLFNLALSPISWLIQVVLGLVEHFPMRLGYEVTWIEMPGWICASILLILFGYILRSKTIDQELIFR